MSKKLIAYFSAGGSTAKLAKTLAAAAEAELYEIRPAVPYQRGDLNWMDKKARSTVEMADPNCRPAMAAADAPVAEEAHLDVFGDLPEERVILPDGTDATETVRKAEKWLIENSF